MLKFFKIKHSKTKESNETLLRRIRLHALVDLISGILGVIIFILEMKFGDYLLLTAAWFSALYSQLAMQGWIEVIITKKKLAIVEAIILTIIFLFIFTIFCIDIIFHL